MAKVDPANVQKGSNPKPSSSGSASVPSSTDSKAQAAINRRLANDPKAAKIIGKAGASLLKGTTTSLSAVGSSFENLGKNFLVTSESMAASKPYRVLMGSLVNTTTGVTGGLDTFTSSVTGNIDKFSLQIRKNLEPFSEYVGSTLGTLTGIIEDPTGPNGLGNVATKLLNKVSPGSGDKINNLNKNLNLQAISRFPGQMMAGIDHILTGLRNLLSVPLNILSEIYFGYQAIMQSISKMINGVMESFSQLLLNFLDSIIPIMSLLELLDAISTLASQIGDIAGAFNVTAITDVTDQLTSFTDTFTNIVKNPLDFGASFLPPSVSGFLGDLQNPQALIESFLPEQVTGFIDGIQNPNNLIKQFLPPEMANGFDKLADMTGFGYHNNLGIGFKSVLEGTQRSVLQDVVASFDGKLGALGPILTGQSDKQPETKTPELKDSKYNAAFYNEWLRQKPPQFTPSRVR
jgi:hypothetical protein